MAWIELALLLTAAALTAVALHRSLRRERAIAALADHLHRSGALLIELERRIEQQRRVADAQQLTETAVAVGTEAMRKIHFGIASIPFGVLESLPATRDTSKLVRETHDLIANAVYGSIRGANRIAGQATRGALGLDTTAGKPQRRKPDEPGA